MSLVNLEAVLQPALKGGYAVAGLVTLGWEDMRAYIAAAEAEDTPVILQAGPGCREHTPLPILGKMFSYLAENASVPVVAHLDHGYTLEECRIAIESGFSSVMYDGSRKSLQQNIDETAQIVQLAHTADVSCEGEIGFVGYADGENSAGTDPYEAKQFAEQTNVDAMAISVGNVHLQQSKASELNEDRILEIDSMTNVPLVIHGGSGVASAQRTKLARETSICKFNIGTELRMAFGDALRDALGRDDKLFDRNVILKQVHDPLVGATRSVLNAIREPAHT